MLFMRACGTLCVFFQFIGGHWMSFSSGIYIHSKPLLVLLLIALVCAVVLLWAACWCSKARSGGMVVVS